MALKVLSWNLRKSTKTSQSWQIIQEINPDIATLQEVNAIPDFIKSEYSMVYQRARNKDGKDQKFGTAILSKFPIWVDWKLESKIDWVNTELENFSGNLTNCTVPINKNLSIQVISVYIPPWKINTERLENVDYSPIKLENNSDLWVSDLLWAALKLQMKQLPGAWLIAGDFNSSVTFDWMWRKKPRGNQEIIDRMHALGLKECCTNGIKSSSPPLNIRGIRNSSIRLVICMCPQNFMKD